ncbi:MAG: DUF3068 domain-containing protein [Anaerolineae bacterium]|nr:DUF3068 domain-containing protein [Anaerolineae bacterium]
MNNKILGGGLLGLGVILIVIGVLLMAVIVPGMKQLPDDVDTTRLYAGTMPVLLNPATFEFMTDLTVDLERHFKAEDTDGDNALVYEAQTLSVGGQSLQQIVKHYSVDRKTMEWDGNYPDSWAETDGFWQREGLVMGWSMGSEEKDYVGWSDDYRATVPLTFEEKQKHDRSGLDVLYFTSESPAMEIVPEHVQAIGLPTALPKEQFAALVQGAQVSDTLKTMLPAALRAWDEDTVPLQYFYEYEAKYWVEPETGVLIDTWKHELRKATLGPEFIASIPLLQSYIEGLSEEERAASRIPIFDLTYQATDETVQDAKKDAQDAIDQINLFGTTIPIILIIIGALAGAGGAFLFTRKTQNAA